MKKGLKKALCAVSAAVIAFSMTGCIHLKGTFNKSVYLNELKAAIAKGDFVEEWTGDIPEGMKVKYVPVREWSPAWAAARLSIFMSMTATER